MKIWLLDKGWYLIWWLGIFLAARIWLVNPVVKAIEKLTEK